MSLIKCSACGADVSPQALACPYCGQPIRNEAPFGQQGYRPNSFQQSYGPYQRAPVPEKDKTVAAVLAILLGCLGIDLLYCGKTTAGVTLLIVNIVLSCTAVVPCVFAVLGIVRGIKMLSSPQEVFERDYVNTPNEWPLI